MSDEQWLPVVGWEGLYEVSDQGRVKSICRTVVKSNGQAQRVPERIMKPVLDTWGYPRLQLHRAGHDTAARSVHALVLEAFVGPAWGNNVCLHRNGNPADSRLSNLHWGSLSENARDQFEHGTRFQSNKTHCRNGHPYDEVNTLWVKGRTERKVRVCKVCAYAQNRARYHQRKLERAAIVTTDQ